MKGLRCVETSCGVAQPGRASCRQPLLCLMAVLKSSLWEDACVEWMGWVSLLGYANGFAMGAILSAGVAGFPEMLWVNWVLLA